MTQRVFVDANVFFSRTLTDWLFLLRFETEGMFQVHTTEDVFAEVIYRMRKKNPTAPGRFFLLVGESSRGCVPQVIEKQIEHWKHDARRVQLDEMLERAGCPKFAVTVRELLRQRALRP